MDMSSPRLLYIVFLFVTLLLVIYKDKPLYLFDEYGYPRNPRNVIGVLFLIGIWSYLVCSHISETTLVDN